MMVVKKITWYNLRNGNKQVLLSTVYKMPYYYHQCTSNMHWLLWYAKLFIYIIFLYVEEEVWSIFSWFTNAISRLLSFHCWVETYSVLRNKALLRLMTPPPLSFLFDIICRTLGHSRLFSEHFGISPMVIFPTEVLPLS